MRKPHLFLLILTATMVFVTTAEAKIRDKSWEFGAAIGNVDGDRGANIANGTAFELRFGYNITAKVEAELSLSSEQSEHGDLPTNQELAEQATAESGFIPCPGNVQPSDPPCISGFTAVKGTKVNDDHFFRAILSITGNFLTDRDTRTIPYITAGFGIIQEKRDGFPFTADLVESVDHDMDPNTPRQNTTVTHHSDVFESFDASAILTLGVGARTFLSDNWGVRYEARYNHHDSFDAVQDEYVISAGVTWVVGGKK